ncbi:MAG: hypothetical protein CME32_06090 [Gimesia sp.]|nr:hypothetical protein [Gimesia sp.]
MIIASRNPPKIQAEACLIPKSQNSYRNVFSGVTSGCFGWRDGTAIFWGYYHEKHEMSRTYV